MRAELRAVESRLERALPGARIASYASTGDRAFVSADGRTTFAIAYPRRDPNSAFGENPDAAKRARAELRGVTVAGAPVHLTGYDALVEDSGEDARGSRHPDRGGGRRPGRPRGARFRVRVVPRARPDVHGDRVDHDHVPPPVGPHDLHRRLTDRAVPGRADRARRRDRLRAADRRALARGARARAHRGRGDPARDGDVRARGRVQRHDGRDRPAGARRPSPPVPAQRRLRRHADPARQHGRRDHAAARRAGEMGTAARLAPPAHRRQGEPRMDALGRGRRAPSLARRGRVPRHRGRAGGRRLEYPAGPVRPRHDRQAG